jgi:PIN domain nuclease of toxin-antitoxin system
VERIEVTYLDTHVVVWLYTGDSGKLSAAAVAHIEEDNLFVSPAVILELEFLYEIRRGKAPASKVIAQLSRDVGLRVCELTFATVVEDALQQKWVRDPFDRLIVAQASSNEAPLVTKDEKIRRHYRRAVW